MLITSPDTATATLARIWSPQKGDDGRDAVATVLAGESVDGHDGRPMSCPTSPEVGDVIVSAILAHLDFGRFALQTRCERKFSLSLVHPVLRRFVSPDRGYPRLAVICPGAVVQFAETAAHSRWHDGRIS